MFMYDAYQSRKNVEDFEIFTLDEVDKAFEMMTQLKYNQTMPLKGKPGELNYAQFLFPSIKFHTINYVRA